MFAVQRGPAIGLLAGTALLSALAGTIGLGAAGWAVGLTCASFTYALLVRGFARYGCDRLGPADRVTLGRAVLACGVAALTADSYRQPVSVTALVSLAVVALLLDSVDGRIARRTRTESTLGALFDGEADAFLILVLSVYVARSVGAWVLAIGAARYVFLAAGWLLPWMRSTLPPRFWRKTVTALQGIALTFAASAIGPRFLSDTAVFVALVLLSESFGRDVVWLWRRRPVERGHREVSRTGPAASASASGRRRTSMSRSVIPRPQSESVDAGPVRPHERSPALEQVVGPSERIGVSA